MKIAIITCYKQPDYVRATVLRRALGINPTNQLFVIKNKHLGFLRYPEVFFKVIAARLKHRPDLYILTFRGFEMLTAVNLLSWPKPLIFDELVNPLEWLEEPRPEAWAKFVPKSLLRQIYRILLKRSKYILTDTEVHSRHSAILTNGSEDKRYINIPVSTNEKLFIPKTKQTRPNGPFKVFNYSNMLPLHGMEYVLGAAIKLNDEPVEFTLVGGNEQTAKAVRAAQAQGAKIIYHKWVDFDKLPELIHGSDLCLGGPFGGTVQSDHVITGKSYQFIACGAPTLIGTNKASELFINKENCLAVPQKDAAALADAIEWAQKHPKELENIGKNGRNLYESDFSNKVIAKQLDDLLQNLG